MKFTLTNDPIVGKSPTEPSKYQEIFDGLSPAKPCVVFDDVRDAANFKQRLEAWIDRHCKGAKARSTSKYPATASRACGWCIRSRSSPPRPLSVEIFRSEAGND